MTDNPLRPETDAQQFVVDPGYDNLRRDNPQKLPIWRFAGWLLGSVNTRRNNSYKWTELELYLTEAGKMIYVSRTCREDAEAIVFANAKMYDSLDDLTRHEKMTVPLQRLLGEVGVEEIQIA